MKKPPPQTLARAREVRDREVLRSINLTVEEEGITELLANGRRRVRCRACRKYFASLVIDGKFCAWKCAEPDRAWGLLGARALVDRWMVWVPEDLPRGNKDAKAFRFRVEAMRRGAPPETAELVYQDVVWARSGPDHLCGICGKPVERYGQHGTGLRLSMDHTVPVSKGGEHTYANIQISHHRCNQDKSDSMPEIVTPQGEVPCSPAPPPHSAGETFPRAGSGPLWLALRASSSAWC